MRRSVSYAAGVTFAEALELESAMMTKTGATADHRAAVAAFVAKEKPVLRGPLTSCGGGASRQRSWWPRGRPRA